jgi:hypothetical protein
MAARVGDTVEVPGGMSGTVKFIGAVDGKNGTFAGVQLSNPYAARGKNSGEVEGRYYFRTTIPGSGIFLPVEKAVKKGSPTTPKASGLSNFNQGGRTPMPSLPKPNFSQSIGPGARAASPALRPTGRRESLPRPSSPLRKVQTPAPNKLATPKTRPSIGLAKSTMGNGPQYRGSPSLSMKKNQFSQSLRQSSVTPAKKSLSPLGPEASYEEEADSTPTPTPTPIRTIDSAIQDEEVKRLKTSLEQRDTQLKDQAASIAEMERSLEQLQALIPDSDVERPPSYTSEAAPSRPGSKSQEISELRDALREKNDKIRMLTAEFDANRADFRSTIDTLEMASTETERVYEKRVDELLDDLRHLQDSREDVEGVAQQFKQLEELVQELEEGLEEARRGEAEARGEVEFLRGEVERTRSELRREKEKKRTERALNGEVGVEEEERVELLQMVEQKDDEIRGLKAIVHSLNGGHSQSNGKVLHADSSLHAQIQSLEALLEQKSEREEELTRELSRVQSVPRFPPPPPLHAHRANGSGSKSEAHQQHQRGAGSKSSNRLSDRTVVPSVGGQAWQEAEGEGENTEDLPENPRKLDRVHEDEGVEESRGEGVLDSGRSDGDASASSGALWCEICETGGHDILTCKDMFGQGGNGNGHQRADSMEEEYRAANSKRDSARPAPLVSRRSQGDVHTDLNGSNNNNVTPRAQELKQNPMDMVGPVAGKLSGRVDEDKWCAFCERDGHESVDCPFEDAF